jgi:hypothetical protein
MPSKKIPDNEPKKRQPPYDVLPGFGTMADYDKRIVDRKSKQSIGKVIDQSRFSDGGPSFKPEWEAPYTDLNRQFLPRFETFEKAAQFLWNVTFAANMCRAKIPVTNEVLDYVRREGEDLRRQADAVRSMAMNVYHKQQTLRHMAKSLGIDGIAWEIGEDDDVRKLADFKVLHDGEEIPFFSEAYLYETIGKEEARTLRSLMRTFITKIDPLMERAI